jgi:AraC-like DNA-binding protein
MGTTILDGFSYGYATSVSKIGRREYHYHNEYELYFLLKGKSEYFIKDKTYSIEENYMVLIPKNELHSNFYLTENIERYVLNFSEKLIPEAFLDKTIRLFDEPVYIPHHPYYLKRIMADIINEYRKNDPFSADIIHCRLMDILSYLLRNPSLSVPEKTAVSHPAIVTLTDYINKNYSSPLTLEASAKMLNMSRTYLSKLFHSNTGFTFKNYLSIIRIKHAKELLADTTSSVTDIAYECGFEDSNYFSTSFKKSEGMSPLEYRKAANLREV